MSKRPWSAETRAKHAANLPPLAERILARIEYDPFGGCWLWTGAHYSIRGYGRIVLNGRHVAAHRASYMAFRGAPGDLLVCHKCDVPLCVNPAHLWLGTDAENSADKHVKGRASTLAGDAHPSAKLTSSTVLEMRRLRLGGWKYREIAEKFDVSIGTVGPILAGYYWKDVVANNVPAEAA